MRIFSILDDFKVRRVDRGAKHSAIFRRFFFIPSFSIYWWQILFFKFIRWRDVFNVDWRSQRTLKETDVLDFTKSDVVIRNWVCVLSQESLSQRLFTAVFLWRYSCFTCMMTSIWSSQMANHSSGRSQNMTYPSCDRIVQLKWKFWSNLLFSLCHIRKVGLPVCI